MMIRMFRLSTFRVAVYLCGSMLVGRLVLFSSQSQVPETYSWATVSTVSPRQNTRSSLPFIRSFNRTKDTNKVDQPPWTVNSLDGLTLDQETFRDWLHPQLPVGSKKLGGGTFDNLPGGVHGSCGFSMFLNYGKQRVFFKHARMRTDQMEAPEAETHLREIKAAYLDRILGTHVSPACIGLGLKFKDIKQSFLLTRSDKRRIQRRFYWNTRCAARNGTLEGSLMFAVDGIQDRNLNKVITAAISPHDHSEFAESARRYAVFNYLAGCSKSSHNHFVFHKRRMVAIDNDRCFTPNRVLANTTVDSEKANFKALESTVFGMCQFSDSLLHVLETAENGERISEQLIRALQGDALSESLLSEQPDVFHEIDTRASRLLQHIRDCRSGVHS